MARKPGIPKTPRNQKPTDGRKHNKRLQSKQETREIVARAKSLPPAQPNQASKDRIPAYAARAMKKIFGSEAEAWEFIAEKAQEGSFAHLNLLFQYKYGKPVEREAPQGQARRNAPVINFINNSPQPSADLPKTIDLDDEDFEDIEEIDNDDNGDI